MPPAIKYVDLRLTPEEWELLCNMCDWHAKIGVPPLCYSLKDFNSLREKISEINKRLCFAASLPDN